MCANYVGNVVDLEQRLDSAKQSLVILNENIRRFSGHSNKELWSDKPSFEVKREVDRDRQLYKIDKFKRRSNDAKTVFSRLSASTQRSSGNEESRPRVTSRVIRELPTKEEIVEAQGIDSASRARNRRIFGSLIGTLQKFCQEESRLKEKEDKKAQIEKKLELQELEERESLKKKRESLLLDKKRKQLEIKTLEIKMTRLNDFKTWEETMLHNKNYLRTKTKPHIYFKPRLMSKCTEQLLAKTKLDIDNLIVLKREQTHKELNDLDNNLDSDADQMDNIADIESQDNEFAISKVKVKSKIDIANSSEDIENGKSDIESKKDKNRGDSKQLSSNSVIIVNKKQENRTCTE